MSHVETLENVVYMLQENLHGNVRNLNSTRNFFTRKVFCYQLIMRQLKKKFQLRSVWTVQASMIVVIFRPKYSFLTVQIINK